MNRTSEVLSIFLFILVCFLLVSSYYKFIVTEDYIVETEAPCNPEQNSCFVRYCNDEYEDCTDPALSEPSYYKLVYGPASKSSCVDEDCTFICSVEDPACGEVHCDPSDVETECSNSFDLKK